MLKQNVFQRYELKYMLTTQQKETILKAMESYMALDRYGRAMICNLYFDTDNYRLIRRSIEKPVYKEKLRIRSYGRATSEREVFVELKKKYKNVVYKRRIAMSERKAMKWLCDGNPLKKESQISQEIAYFRDYYENLSPKVFLAYEREAYYSKDGSDFRVTFDDYIVFRQTELTLNSEVYGTPILEEGKVLMEIKCSGGIPLWMARTLSEENIYKTSFSKYGTAYREWIYPNLERKE